MILNQLDRKWIFCMLNLNESTVFYLPKNVVDLDQSDRRQFITRLAEDYSL